VKVHKNRPTWFLFPAADCKSVAIICRVAAVRFDSFRDHQTCTVRLSVRTQAFHACKTGSIPVPCTRCTASLYAVAGRPLDASHEASQTATKVPFRSGTWQQFRCQSVHGRTPACHAGRRGSLPLGTAMFCSHSLMAKLRPYTPAMALDEGMIQVRVLVGVPMLKYLYANMDLFPGWCRRRLFR
jgi:hypothetical protein